MEYTAGTIGRVFFLRVDHGEDLIEALQTVSRKENIRSAFFFLLGAIEQAELVAGPRAACVPPVPMWVKIGTPHEIIGIGNVFYEGEGPKVHLHCSIGRDEIVRTGCLRNQSKAFMVNEVCILEISGINAARVNDIEKGYSPVIFGKMDD
ncbi:PPC domain-containing DNA-binding protein [Methanomethylovorans sp.]|uniref:PPC domain-containing DNA-binding protein n=1 Tax=Methanomethylovorans sp. TaxID=2758717 RepID=UPI00351C767C